jgi:hypothetical protein
MPTNDLRIMSVRLPGVDVRRFKSVAASRGVSVQEAVHQALESWVAQVPNKLSGPLDDLEGSLADVDVTDLLRQEKELELSKDAQWK